MMTNPQQVIKNFERSKVQCLAKRDKSFAGRIDPRAVEICAVINERHEYYTTSSCSGRCFLFCNTNNGNTTTTDNDNDNVNNNHTTNESNDNNNNNKFEASGGDGGIRKTSSNFVRFRVSHDMIQDPDRYFDLSTLDKDSTGGADPLRTVGQYDHKLLVTAEQEATTMKIEEGVAAAATTTTTTIQEEKQNQDQDQQQELSTTTTSVVEEAIYCQKLNLSTIIWFRLEPFILHVACGSLSSASAFMAAVRPTFKNVGLTSWNDSSNSSSSNNNGKQNLKKYIVAVWGDEGLDMPLRTPDGVPLFQNTTSMHWLASLVNERMERNWLKISKVVESIRNMAVLPLEQHEIIIVNQQQQQDYPNEDGSYNNNNDRSYNNNGDGINNDMVPKSYDVIGDIAVLYTPIKDKDKEKAVGKAILSRNKSIKIVAVRDSKLQGMYRSPAANVPITDEIEEGSVNNDSDNNNNNDKNIPRSNNNSALRIIANSVKIQKNKNKRIIDDSNTDTAAENNNTSLITTHCEYGIKCVVDLNHVFFSPRMSFERLRICQQVARGENVLVLFAGIGLEMFLIASKTECTKVVGVEKNAVAVRCIHRGLRILQRNKSVMHKNPCDKITIYEDDVCDVLPKLLLPSSSQQTQEQEELSAESNQEDSNDKKNPSSSSMSQPLLFDRVLAPRPKEGYIDGDLSDTAGGKQFLKLILPVMKDRGECHWYDFVADHEFPTCERSINMIKGVCKEQQQQQQNSNDPTMNTNNDIFEYDIEIIHVANAGSVAKRQLRVCIDFRVIKKIIKR